MRKYLGVIVLFVVAVFCTGGCGEVSAAEVTSVAITEKNFPDKRVRAELSIFDKDNDKVLSEKEIQEATELGIGESDNREDYDLKGISKLSQLKTVYIEAFEIKNINELKKLTQLRKLTISAYDLCPVDTSKNLNLRTLELDIPLKKQIGRASCRERV